MPGMQRWGRGMNWLEVIPHCVGAAIVFGCVVGLYIQSVVGFYIQRERWRRRAEEAESQCRWLKERVEWLETSEDCFNDIRKAKK